MRRSRWKLRHSTILGVFSAATLDVQQREHRLSGAIALRKVPMVMWRRLFLPKVLSRPTSSAATMKIPTTF